MSIEPISVRDFLRNFASVVSPDGKKKYLIMKRGKPIGVFTPWNLAKKEASDDDAESWSILEQF